MPVDELILWALGIVGGFAALLGTLAKMVIPKIVDSKINNASLVTKSKMEAEAYSRARETFKQDTTFELLKETLAYLLKELEADREEAKESRKQQAELIQSINRIALNVDQNTQVQRMVVQTLSKFDDRLEHVERVLSIEAKTNRD